MHDIKMLYDVGKKGERMKRKVLTNDSSLRFVLIVVTRR